MALATRVTPSCCGESSLSQPRPGWMPHLPPLPVWAASCEHASSPCRAAPITQRAAVRLRRKVELSPKWLCLVTSCYSPLPVKWSLETAAGSPLPQVLTLFSTAVLHIWEEDVSLAPKERVIPPTRMAWKNACCADSAKRVPSTTLMKP